MTTRNDARNETADLGKSAAMKAGGRRPSSLASSLPHIPTGDNAEAGAGMSPLSRAIWLLASYGIEREARERAAAPGAK